VPVAEAVIVPGAYVFPDGRVSEMLADRLDAGYMLYRAGKARKIIVSGDHGRTTYDEVNSMRKYLQAKGVPREDIFMDHAGFDTYDSIYRARDVFQVKKAIIVTQRYHLLRAVYIARMLGIEAHGVTSDAHNYPRMMYYNLREIAARVKAFLQAGVMHPDPKYLGKAIPISGSGVLTDDGK
jgi:SanA protein